ncbi:hypothetical protein TSAR_013596 [Trichomalopsis sarcophagae]|uniref:Uncharacterized protein n=1 Tax=Trichomalopsis sarcophagae TaxID=543379 RepID=A0A232F9H7_9HYME|nr:hypothetical protein TSAR_013596 [Trichomalopsis sarcophagae]
MRQVVVLEPAGSVLVIRQHSLGSATTTNGSCATNQSTTASSNALEVTAANTPADHNQNRIVVVRSSALQPPAVTSAENNVNNNNNNNKNNNNSSGRTTSAQVAKTIELRQERSQGIGDGKKAQLNRTSKDDSVAVSESKIAETADATTLNGK